MRNTAGDNPPANDKDDSAPRPSNSAKSRGQSQKSTTTRPAIQPRSTLSSKRNAPSFLSQVSSLESPPASQESATANSLRTTQLDRRLDDVQDKVARPSPPIPSPASLQQLREAVKNAQGRSVEKIKSQTSLSGGGNTGRVVGLAAGESEAMSPTVEAAFNSPLATGTQSASTESTESAKTVRGTVMNTPSDIPVRTPSYPFPYVASRISSGYAYAMHQPFTALSPTVSLADTSLHLHGRDMYTTSAQSTPVGHPGLFSPASPTPAGTERQSAIQGPNLYDVVLRLNMDPALASWWETLTNVLHEHYKVERASLALPADVTDIENVPWGQKALYNWSGLRMGDVINQSFGQSNVAESETSRSSSSKKSDPLEAFPAPSGRPGSLRPSIESRHSFAGWEYGRRGPAGEGSRMPSPAARPPTVRRTTMHVASQRRGSLISVGSALEPPTPIQENVQEGDASLGYEHGDSSEEEVNTIILPVLRALDREEDALLDSAGVNRILERGRIVTLTRNYPSDFERRRKNSQATSERSQSKSREVGEAHPSGRPQSTARVPLFRKGMLGSGSTESKGRGDAEPYFEEYEQLPTSPWAQSPAPSPAIQNDPEQNPFFVTGRLEEETFSPTMSPAGEDYSRFQEVEAIGVDQAATIVHIPLIHPLLSRVLPSDQGIYDPAGVPSTSDEVHVGQRKAPIAILSILSPDVPYSPSLIHSLKCLGPHLATSFQTSLQNTLLQERITATLYRQQRHGRGTDAPTMPLVGLGFNLGLETLLHFDPDDSRSSTIESLASPSDYSGYSGRSRHSPTGSVVATPALDTGVYFRNASATTPGQLGSIEPSENYFEVKKRATVSRSRSGGPVSQSQQASQSAARAPSADHRSALRKVEISPSQEGATQPKKDSKKARMKGDKTMVEQSPIRKRGTTTAEQDESRHSVLHSYGADFSASFQSLPVAAVPRTPSNNQHARSISSSELFDMPPPSERLLRTIIDSLPVQIFTAAPVTGRVTWVNSKYLVYRGQTPRQVLADPWEPMHPEDLDDYRNDWVKSLHTGQQFQHKVRLRRFDDHYRWYYVRAAPLRDKTQTIVHWVGTMIDLHDQHVAEVNASRQQETAASEAKYRALANSSPQIVFAATKDRGITFCNDQWQAYSGQTEQQAKSIGFMECVHPEDLAKCKLPVIERASAVASKVPLSEPPPPRRTRSGISETESDASNDSTVTATAAASVAATSQVPQRKSSELASMGKPSYSTEVRLRMKSGEYRWHLVRVLLAEPLASADTEEETWYGTCTDINDHKELEQTLKETMDAKSRFLSNMSHEIRTPLNGIAGMANFLIDSNLTPEQLDHVNVIRASTEGLRDLINDILDLSKVEAGMINLNMDWLHIRSVIEEVNDLTSSLALEKGLELNYLVEDTVPSVVKGDKFRFRQVLLNVIGNAIKFTPEGEVFTHCKLEPGEDSEHLGSSVVLVVDIVDTGRGFTEKEAERLFKRFSQIDGSSTRQHGGTGLGLAISMQLVELHGGTMSAKSIPGQGSTFTFSIKFALPTATDHPVDMPPSPPIRVPVDVILPAQPITKAEAGLPYESTEELAPRMPSIDRSPTFYTGLEQRGHESPSLASSGSSDPSITNTTRTSSSSSGSSQSSVSIEAGAPVQLGPIPERHQVKAANKELIPPHKILTQARVFSVMVVCTLKWARMATVAHLNAVLNHSVPHMITSKESAAEVQRLLSAPEPIRFSHIVVVVQDAKVSIDLIRYLLQATPASTALIVITNMSQRREIVSQNAQLDFESLANKRRLQFLQKPVKPSRMGVIFDPEKSRELSTDQNQQSAQQIALTQKRVFDEMTRRLGGKNFKVLLVEDNRINQMVMLKLLRRVSVDVDTCLDGVQATDKVLSMPPEHYSIILLDLMMPNKDGYQTCIDIRAWENRIGAKNPIPIVALSANVLDDVWQKCREAGFNSYLTKPVEFKELSDVMVAFLDPDDPSKPMPSMGDLAGHGAGSGGGSGGLSASKSGLSRRKSAAPT